ncbi:universal stress protein [Terrabacter sp. GCM10028922]|uniref:universal stress protein n=1 Tax=Terrabacter sp. GCM10028922 TaxID=3273428 RepID=UPI003623590E
MTIIAGFSSSRQGSAPLNLAAQLARTTGEKVIAAVVVERSRPPGADRLEDEYQRYVSTQATQSLERVVSGLSEDVDVSVVVHQSTSIPQGLTELVDDYGAELVVVGSSSSGLLGRVTLGSVTERLVHTAAVPVAIAPRGYPRSPAPIQRLTAAYGGPADGVDLIESAAALAKKWAVRMRIASFTVRPAAMFGGSIERGAEDLIVQRWSRRVREDALKRLDDARARVAVPDVDVVIGAGIEWRDAVDDIPWGTRDMLLLGSGAAGPMAQVFLGSAASKILRHAPVPAMILPREQT